MFRKMLNVIETLGLARNMLKLLITSIKKLRINKSMPFYKELTIYVKLVVYQSWPWTTPYTHPTQKKHYVRWFNPLPQKIVFYSTFTLKHMHGRVILVPSLVSGFFYMTTLSGQFPTLSAKL